MDGQQDGHALAASERLEHLNVRSNLFVNNLYETFFEQKKHHIDDLLIHL